MPGGGNVAGFDSMNETLYDKQKRFSSFLSEIFPCGNQVAFFSGFGYTSKTDFRLRFFFAMMFLSQ